MADKGKKTSFSAQQIDEASGQARLASWRDAGFFAPVPAPAPVAQEAVQGRQYDYGQGFNLLAKPRQEEAPLPTFQLLRNLADNFDLLRCVIETRKDQLVGMSWNIVARDADTKLDKGDKRVKDIEKLLRKPDGVLSWDEWLRMLVEDMLVVDAATVYPRKTVGGGLHSLDVVDGATIKLLINQDGRIPLAPEPAYVQVIKGMQAAQYTTDELIYKPRNRRSWRHYGYSPVEQIMMTVNIALRRQLSQLQYYTEGNVPEAMAACPPEWGPDQIKEMQLIWDNLIGQQDARRHMRFIPGGVDLKFTREPTLKDTFDEWLARIVCYAFSVSSQALVQMMNRATAESAAETAQLEGLAPLQLWVKSLVDDIIENHLGYDDLVFEWDSGEELDPKAQAEIHGIYLDKNVITIDEVRTDLGRDQRGASNNVDTATPSGAAPVPGAAPLSVVPGQPAADGTAQVVAAAGAASDPSIEPQLGPDGNPLPAPVPGAAGGGAKVADAAMNGTQVTSLLEIISQVAGKDLPEETAKATIMAAFPGIPPETIDAMLVPLRNFEPPKPEPLLGPDGQPIVPPAGEAPADKKKGIATPAADATPQADDPKKKEAVVEKLAKARSPSREKLKGQQRKKLAAVLLKALNEAGENIAAQVGDLREQVQKSLRKVSDKDAKAKRILAKFDISFEDIEEELLSSLEMVSTGAAAHAVTKLNAPDALDLANTRAEKWASNHAAELVKDLTDSTRDMLRSSIVMAEEQGWSNEQLARELRDNYAFSKQRAETVARTETKMADSEGAIMGWRATGLPMKKEWIRSAGDADCELCEGNEQQGAIDLDESFDSGDDTTPAHPNCECVVVPVVQDEDE